MKIKNKKIIVAPLNWGLGHATRCIPIINGLLENGFEPIIASDGVALELLKKEFPKLISFELPSYNIQYAEKGKNFKWKMIIQLPKIISAIRKERRKINKIIKAYNFDGIISDNRFGVYSAAVPSVFMTHQLNVLTGNTSWFTTKIHKKIIQKFNECWIPDVENGQNLSGKLGHSKAMIKNVKYIGALSRFEKKELPMKYDLMVLLSGPEPQRTLVENKIISELENYPKKVIFIKGIVEKNQIIEEKGNVVFYNFMTSQELEITLNESNRVLCRSGYTSVMDLAKLHKKAFFIPTPGQFEQEYLAKKFEEEKIIPMCNQEEFTIEQLTKIDFYKGFTTSKTTQNWNELFDLF